MSHRILLVTAGFLMWACCLAGAGSADPPRSGPATPAEELDSSDLQSLLPPNGLPKDQIDEAVESLADEGDRLANLGRYREAIHYYSSALTLAPRDASLYSRRAAAYRKLGESQLADQDMGRAVYFRDLPEVDDQGISLIVIDSAKSALKFAAIAWLGLAIAYGFVGYRQSREGGGTALRLIGVAVAAALIALLPLFVWLIAQALGEGGPFEQPFAILTTAVSCLWMALVLRPPLRPYPSQPRLPLVEDSAVLARVAELAAATRIAVPRVRLLRSLSSAQQVMAWAGGLPQPSVFVTDGLLNRLDAAERDAIIAHEMGHIANHSLWPLSSVFSVSCAVAMLVSLRTSAGVALAFGYAFSVGLRRILSRPIEADCDRRAARAIGFRQTISALTKVHALLAVRTTGLLPLVAYAWATHPSREVRLTLLARAAAREAGRDSDNAAQSADGQSLAQSDALYTPSRFRLHRTISWLGVALWVAGLATAWWIAPTASAAVIWLLVAIGMIPGLLLGFSRTAAAKRAVSRQRLRSKWVGLLQLAGFFLLILSPLLVARLADHRHENVVAYVALFVPVVLLVWLIRILGGQGLHRRITEALRDHRFADVLAIGRANRKRLARKPILRYNVALIEALHGDRAFGIAEFEKLQRKYRSFALPVFMLGMLYFEQGDNELALEIARLAAKRWPKDPQPAIDEARVLRQLGRLDEAQTAIDRALQLDPQAGSAHAIAAGLALDRGDVVKSRELAARAAELEPGGLSVIVAEAEVALAGGDRELARTAVNRAVNTIKSNPFALRGVEIARLEQKLAALEPQQLDAEKVPS